MANKIYLNSTFGYREDTLKNWQTANPVLEKGELSFVRDGFDGKFVKIGDGHTKWNDLPFAPLPKGEKGEKGEPGGDYVLTEADKTEIADKAKPFIDQTFLPTSLNAQSGKAVAEAVSGKEDKKKWELLKEITLEESVSAINGGSLDKKYKELWIEAVINFETDYTTAKIALFYIDARLAGVHYTEYWNNISNGRTERLKAHCCVAPSGSLETTTFHSTSYYLASTPKTTAFANKFNWSSGFDSIRLSLREESGSTGIRFGVGTTVKVWGLEA